MFFRLAEQSYVNTDAINALNFISSQASPDNKPYVEIIFNQGGLQFPFTDEVAESVKTNLGIDLVDIKSSGDAMDGEVVPAGDGDVVNPSEVA